VGTVAVAEGVQVATEVLCLAKHLEAVRQQNQHLQHPPELVTLSPLEREAQVAFTQVPMGLTEIRRPLPRSLQLAAVTALQ
jgi:hypothetical protein